MRRLVMRRGLRPREANTDKPVAITIVRIKLEQLFGLYNYDIPGDAHQLGRAPILYGENGYGKTNILKILFHLLSPGARNGHRHALGQIKFKRVDVYLSNQVVVTALRPTATNHGPIRLEVHRTGDLPQLLGAWDWYPEEEKSKDSTARILSHVNQEVMVKMSVKERNKAFQSALFEYIEKESNPLESEEAFLRALQENVPPIFLLGADRILSSDHVNEIGPLDFDRRFLQAEHMMRIGRERALAEALQAAARRFSQLAVNATRLGSRSMHSIYQDMLKRLASRSRRKSDIIAEPIPVITEQLSILSDRFSKYAKYGLAPEIDGNGLNKLLAEVRPSEKSIAGEILRPYVESLQEQANSFEQAYEVIDTLVSTVNEFLFDKSIEFKLGQGIVVRNRLGESIEPHDLSSGEQQLLLLLCHIAIANETGGIFIIDEPEISLNIRWQRRLVDALLQLDLAKNLQFVLASHSMEILTKHRESVVRLQEVTDA